jgi:hypothetical protein
MQTERKKSCPKCGTINNLEAKVCIQCGHRFRTPFRQPNMPQATRNDKTDMVAPLDDPLEGSPAPDLSSEELDELRDGVPNHDDPYDRLKRSLQRKDRKP